MEAQVFKPEHALGLPMLLALTKVAVPDSTLGWRMEGAMGPEGTEAVFSKSQAAMVCPWELVWAKTKAVVRKRLP